MNKKEFYIRELHKITDWTPYLLKESGLPGKRANLELVHAVADTGDETMFRHFLSFDAGKAPIDSPYEFLPLCGIVGLGRLLAEGRTDLLEQIRDRADDPRWRMREGVVMALYRLGEKDTNLLLQEMELWSTGSLLEKRAAAAAVCHPDFLRKADHALRALTMLDGIMESMCNVEDRRSDEFKALRKGMGYCWSIVVAAHPEPGKKMIEKWLVSKDKDMVWIMRSNLRRNRLIRMDEKWVQKWKARLGFK